jgi:hypothetical protein
MIQRSSFADFDPQEITERDYRMTIAYYGKDIFGLFFAFISFLRITRKLSLYASLRTAYYGSVALIAFWRYGHELTHVIQKYLFLFYREINKNASLHFDDKKASHLEYIYWFADRYRGEDDIVPGQLLAEIASIVFCIPKEKLLEYGKKRDKALHILDAYHGRECEKADWPRYKKLLGESYQELYDALHMT